MINAGEIYSTTQIAQRNMIPYKYNIIDSTLDARKQIVMKLIRTGKLKALNLGSELKPRYAVRGSDLIKFIHDYGKQSVITK